MTHDGFYTAGSTRWVLHGGFYTAGSTRRVLRGGFYAAGSLFSVFLTTVDVVFLQVGEISSCEPNV